MSYSRYTKADLEELVSLQLDNLNAMHDLLRILKYQNALIKSTGKKLEEEMTDLKLQVYGKQGRKKE